MTALVLQPADAGREISPGCSEAKPGDKTSVRTEPALACDRSQMAPRVLSPARGLEFHRNADPRVPLRVTLG